MNDRNRRTGLLAPTSLLTTLLMMLSVTLLTACGGGTPSTDQSDADHDGAGDAPALNADPELPMPQDILATRADSEADRRAWFGDLHVHTTYSFDAFAFGTLATPSDAYLYARGEAIRHPAGYEMRLRRPLDFYAVTDHAMFLGVARIAADPDSDIAATGDYPHMARLNRAENLKPGLTDERQEAFLPFLSETLDNIEDNSIALERIHDITREAWADTVRAADLYYEPGRFTTFAAFEYTSSTDDMGNLHRNVIFRDTDRLPAVPFSRFHDRDPEGLWAWMDGLREQGIEALAIPHNSNGSNGQMFKLADWAGDPLDDDYAERRMRNEPLIEITQIKGTSETHPALSDNDEWAGFEIMPYRIATTLQSEPTGSYAREALLNGLRLEDSGTRNPFRFGFVGSSDAHIAATGLEESDFYGKTGLLDATPQLNGAVPLNEADGRELLETSPQLAKEIDGKVYRTEAAISWGAAGLAAVWAEENTRESIYDAFRRKETFATTGPRIKARFFAGYDFDRNLLHVSDAVARAYRTGVPMGGDLLADAGRVPRLFAWATRDPDGAPLQRLQVVKGWTADGENHEQVFDVACSDGLAADPQTHRCPDNGARVDLADCSIPADRGDAELKAVWEDPQFDPAQLAFYYVRVLENPTCRWSTWQALKEGVPPRPDFPATIQERAFTSPIWYRPD